MSVCVFVLAIRVYFGNTVIGVEDTLPCLSNATQTIEQWVMLSHLMGMCVSLGAVTTNLHV